MIDMTKLRSYRDDRQEYPLVEEDHAITRAACYELQAWRWKWKKPPEFGDLVHNVTRGQSGHILAGIDPSL